MVVAGGALGAVPTAGAQQVSSTWAWNDKTPRMLDVSCSGAGQCVGVGASGWTLHSSIGGEQALAWAGVDLAPTQSLVGVTCRLSRCLAVSGGARTSAVASRVFRSTDGGNTWSAGVELPAVKDFGGGNTQSAADIACEPGGGACVTAGFGGGVWRSVDDGVTWDPLPAVSKLKAGQSFTRVACPDDGLCVLAGTKAASVILRGSTGTAIDSPFGGGATGAATALACDKPTRCTAGDGLGNSVSIEAPWARWGTLKPLPAFEKVPVVLSSLSCPEANTCVGMLSKPAGRAIVTRNLDSGTWRRVFAGSTLGAVSCVLTACTAVGGGAAWSESRNTGDNWGSVNDVPPMTTLECAAAAPAGTCLGGGGSDIAKTTSNGEFWHTIYPGLSNLDTAAITCADYPACLLVGKSKTVYTPDAGNTWNFRFSAGDIAAGPAGAVCVTAVRCYGAGNGSVFTTFDGALTHWQPAPIPTAPMEILSGMSCPTPTLCLVSGSETVYRGELTVLDGQANWVWTQTDAAADKAFKAISCSSIRFCTAVGPGAELGQGQVAWSTDPALLHWETAVIANPDAKSDATELDAVDCPLDGVCVAGALRGFILTTGDGWGTHSLEQLPLAEGGLGTPEMQPDIKGVSCTSGSRCILLGSKTVPPTTPYGALYIGGRTD